MASTEKEYHRDLRRKLKRLKIPRDAVKELGIEIGQGSFAKVRLLEAFGMRCAGKKLHDVLFLDASREVANGLIDKFAEECVRLGELRHPNIVQLVGVIFDEKSLTLVMEYLPLSLTDFLDSYERIPDFTKASILMDVGHGLLYLHEQDPPIVHRDLSTNNILLTSDLQAKISDLGVARRLPPTEEGSSGLVQLMSLCPGTQLFMPPEAKTGSLRDPSMGEYDTKMDCFSFGNIIIQVIVQKWLEYLLEADPDDPSRPLKNEVKRRSLYLQEMSDHMLHDLAVRCLQDNPADRPTCIEIVRKLKAFKDDNPPPFQNSVEMWNAYTDSCIRLRELQSQATKPPLRFEEEDGSSCSFEKLKSRLQALEEELEEKRREVAKKDGEIAGHKSSIVSLKKMLSTANSHEHHNGELPTSPARQQSKTPSPAPPSRDKKKQAPPKPPRPWTFYESSSPPLSPSSPPPPEPSPLDAPTPRPRANTVNSDYASIPQQIVQGPVYTDLPGFPDPYAEFEPRTPVQVRPIRSASSDDKIEISNPQNFPPQPRPRAVTHSAGSLPRPRPRNIPAPAPAPLNKETEAPKESPSSGPAGKTPPQKPVRKGKSKAPPPPINESRDEPPATSGKGRKSSVPDESSKKKKGRKGSLPESPPNKHRNKPLPPIPRKESIALAAKQDELDELAGVYEVPIRVPSVASAGRKKQVQSPEHYEKIFGNDTFGYEVMEAVTVASKRSPQTSPKTSKQEKPPPPPKPYSGPGIGHQRHRSGGVAMLPHVDNEDSQLQKLLLRRQQKVAEGEPDNKFLNLEKQISQPQLSVEQSEVDPTLKRKLAKQKEKIDFKRAPR